MLTRRGLAMGLLACACFVAGTGKTVAGQIKGRAADDDVTAYSSIAPPFITSAKDSFVTREGHSDRDCDVPSRR